MHEYWRPWHRNFEVAYNRFHSVVGGTAGYVGADPSWGGKAFKVHHNVFYKGKPIGSTGQMRIPHIIWCFDVTDTVMRVFNNTIVDSSRSSRLWEDQWIKQYYPAKVFVNNLFGWNDHVKWKYLARRSRQPNQSLRNGNAASQRSEFSRHRPASQALARRVRQAFDFSHGLGILSENCVFFARLLRIVVRIQPRQLQNSQN
jgi:hypothetical protein